MKQLQLIRLNHDAFKRALEGTLRNAEDAQYQTRAESSLAEELAKLEQYDIDLATTRIEIEKVKQYVADLTAILVKQEANEADIIIDRNATLQKIHSLQEAGVKRQQPNKGDLTNGEG